MRTNTRTPFTVRSTKLNRRNFLKRGLIFVPAPFAILRARAQSLGLPDGPFIYNSSNGLLPLFTAVTPTVTLRNDTTGALGCFFAMNNTNTPAIQIVALGRYVVAGNSQSHTVCLFNSSAETRSVSINTAGQPAGTFVYGAITPLSSASNMTFGLTSLETNGADQWLDYNSTFTSPSWFASASPAHPIAQYSAGAVSCPAGLTTTGLHGCFGMVNALYKLV